MKRAIHKLTPGQVQRWSKKPGKYYDGGGLYLCVSSDRAAASWIFRYMLSGKSREMGLGSFPEIDLSAARETAAHWRAVKARGLDPIEVREFERASQKLSNEMSFQVCAQGYIAAYSPSWKNAKHRYQWDQSLAAFAFPVLGNVPIGSVDTDMVVRALQPIWLTKTETAMRLRGRIERVLDWATVSGYRKGDNPARWRGHLQHKLPKPPTKTERVEHLAALPYNDVAGFMADLGNQQGIAAAALRFTILTAVRTGEVLGATWSEFDPENAVWTIPANRTKTHTKHRIPLSKPVLAILREQHKATGGNGPVFPSSSRAGKPLSNMAMLKTLQRMGRDDLTVHGFRSTFRDWVEETTAFAGTVAEAALGHLVGDKVEAAYRRGDLFEKRRKLMDAWAKFATTPTQQSAKVVPIRKKAAQSA